MTRAPSLCTRDPRRQLEALGAASFSTETAGVGGQTKKALTSRLVCYVDPANHCQGSHGHVCTPLRRWRAGVALEKDVKHQPQS